MLQADEFVIYRAWPEEEISRAISEFNEQMHSGATSEQLSAGLHGLDFLTRRSELSAVAKERLAGCELEARIRMELYAEEEAGLRTQAENASDVLEMCEAIRRSVCGLQRTVERFKSEPDEEALKRFAERRRQRL